jgi:hypothetical protein
MRLPGKGQGGRLGVPSRGRRDPTAAAGNAYAKLGVRSRRELARALDDDAR